MTKKKFLLVCEGPTDIPVLTSIAKALVNKNGCQIEIVELSPQLDATSGQYPAHGWTAVRAWCLANREKTPADVAGIDEKLRAAVLRKNWRSIVAASGAHGIIVQLDTDIAEKIVDVPASFADSGLSRRAYCEAAIAHWLRVPKVDKDMYLVLSTYSTETWLLACHEPNDPVFADLPIPFNYEDIPDAEGRLLTLGYKKKSGRIKKDTDLYAGYAQNMTKDLAKIRSRCKEAENFCHFVESL
ncbi:hypothetical protein [Massilia yuzhufengensis]|uniref:Uncharacterized protein n=1 Tax=Massilia yuzhufengensis TaxID=1164594 RepID=A0A1I1UYI8_9BURK|nr:hypothetical protein [Massilia yuzhufengensis]SFD75754.1 hypothetical protein SAMN05216204_13625 [Massilia yuzhufengensis]